jgi:cobalamin biosynthesis Mg chelatase CobN
MPSPGQEEGKQHTEHLTAPYELEGEKDVAAFSLLKEELRLHHETKRNRQESKRIAATIVDLINRTGVGRILAAHGIAGTSERGQTILAGIVRGLIPVVSRAKTASPNPAGIIESDDRQHHAETAQRMLTQDYQTIVTQFRRLLNDLKLKRSARRAEIGQLILESQRSRQDMEATIRWSRQMVPPK